LVIHPNDVLILESGGGGGWGNPAERDPASVASDIESGFITNEMAARCSGDIPSPASGGG
jgi:N-methylhydantoinase B